MQNVARVHNCRRIDCDVSFVNVTNDAFLIDQKSGAITKALLLVKDSIRLNDSSLEIAEDWKCDFDLFCEFAVGGNTVNTHTENLSVG